MNIGWFEIFVSFLWLFEVTYCTFVCWGGIFFQFFKFHLMLGKPNPTVSKIIDVILLVGEINWEYRVGKLDQERHRQYWNRADWSTGTNFIVPTRCAKYDRRISWGTKKHEDGKSIPMLERHHLKIVFVGYISSF